ncbi:uncharacterized protein LOC114287362 [Camellia sinensis]|uniref:uncharacterized protein LOC114287362 n=1 Tax=Camellia sinensis TaxID=4442 RepID=UPI001036AA39|nr:uncharacterized protein LOC114287362 [Camellia sinensis]
MDKAISVKLVPSRRNGTEDENFKFRRYLFQWEEEELGRLYEMLLNAPVLREEMSDRLRWGTKTSGLFSIASTYKWCKWSFVDNSRIVDFIWKNVSPPKVQFFSWLAWKERIKTSSYSQRIRVLSDDIDINCIFCKEVVESVNHVLLFCPFTWKIWSRILNWWGIQWVISGSVNSLLNWCTGIKLKKQKNMIWRALPLAVLWSIWKQKNDSIFNNVQVDLDGLCESIKVRIVLWVKTSCPSFKSLVDDSVHNLQQVKFCIRGET